MSLTMFIVSFYKEGFSIFIWKSTSTRQFELVHFFIHSIEIVPRKTFVQIYIYTLLHLHTRLRISYSLQLSTHRLQPQSLIVLSFELRMQSSSNVELQSHPLSNSRHSFLKGLCILLNSQLIMPRNQLNFALDLSNRSSNFTLSLVNFLMQRIFEQLSKLSTLHSLMIITLMLSISQTIRTFQLLTNKAIMTQRLIMMKSLLTLRWTIIRW